MKKKSTEILVQGSIYSLTDMETSSLRLTTEQKMIVAARLNGCSFWQIPEDKHRFVTDEIILATAAITGSNLPETEILAKYLSDEIINLILDFGYEDYTVSEIITSVRINLSNMIKNPLGENLTTFEPSQRVSVCFLSKTLMNYRILRNGIDRLVENKIMGY